MFDININKAEYYNLQEACTYLNTKHNTTNANTDNLLKHIVSYEIRTYVFARGFKITGDYILNSSKNNLASIIEAKGDEDKIRKNVKAYMEHDRQVANDIDCYFNTLLEGDGLFLELNSLFSCYLPLHGKANSINIYEDCLFNDAFSFMDIDDHSKTLNTTKTMTEIAFNDYADSILSMYPRISIPLGELEEFDNLDSLKSHYLSKSSLKIIHYHEYAIVDEDSTLTIEPYFEITKHDLIILHKDLETLETQILENAPVPTKKPISINNGLPRKNGIGHKKQLAQSMACHIAKIEWNKDAKNEIKSTKMADMIYRELTSLGFLDVLPKTVEAIKPWIKSVTPTYASEGGRPKGS